MRKGVILFGVLIFCFSFISSLPILFYQSPTPGDGTSATDIGNFEINVSINNITGLSNIIFNFANTNYTLYNESLILMMNFENRSSLSENDTHVVDLSIFENNGTVSDANLTSSGKYGSAFGFDGNDSISISNSENFNLTDNFTISLWVNVNRTSVLGIKGQRYSSCIIMGDSRVYCRGDNEFGQIGDGSTTRADSFKKVSDYAVSSLGGTYSHVFAILTNGSAIAWGDNDYGYLGDNDAGTDKSSPVFVSGDYNWSSIEGGASHSCGVLVNNTGLCWGRDNFDQLGCNNCGDKSVPFPVSADFNWTYIGGGQFHSCGLLLNGSVACWGRNNNYQVGDGTTSTRATPVIVSGDLNFSQFYVGLNHNCGVLTNGSGLCWGYNVDGQIGDGTITNAQTPTFVSGDYNFSEIISSSGVTTCGILANGSLVCWGYGNSGQLGIGGELNYKTTPQFVSSNLTFTNISFGHAHVLAVASSGDLYCFGNNKYSQCAGDISTGTNFPLKVFPGYNFENIFPTFQGVLGRYSNGTILVWGNNRDGELGTGDKYQRTFPTAIQGDFNVSKCVKGSYSACCLLTNGSVICSGDNDEGQLGNGSTIDRDYFDFASSDFTFDSIYGYGTTYYGILSNGSLLSWGNNNYGQLGNGNTGTDASSPVFVSGDYNWSSFGAGGLHGCGVLTNGSGMCFGFGLYGNLGNSVSSNSNVPVFVSNYDTFANISSGLYHSCGVLINGSVVCWGYNSLGQLGDGTTSTSNSPVYISNSHNFTSIDSGDFVNCGVLTNGSGLCWGRGHFGQLGIAITYYSSSPVFIEGNYNFTSISAGDKFFYGKLVSGDHIAWGSSFSGELGGGTSDPFVPTQQYRGSLLGRSSYTFQIGQTFGGDLVTYVAGNRMEASLSSGWHHVLLNFNGTTQLYVDGSLSDNLNYSLDLVNDTFDLFIGNNSNGTIDEVRIWNRSLSTSEISQVYKSNIEKINATSFNFYSNQTALTVGDYYYYLFATDSHSSYKILTRLFQVIASVTSSDDSSGSGETIISKERLEEGYTRIFVAGQSTSLSVGSKTYVTKVNSVSKESVSVSVGSESVEIKVGTSEKVDLDSDGVYDLEIIVNSVDSSGNANLEFKAISEPVLSESEEAVSEEAKSEEEKPLADKTSNWYLYVLGVVALLIVLGIVLEKIVKGKKSSKRKSRK